MKKITLSVLLFLIGSACYSQKKSFTCTAVKVLKETPSRLDIQAVKDDTGDTLVIEYSIRSIRKRPVIVSGKTKISVTFKPKKVKGDRVRSEIKID